MKNVKRIFAIVLALSLVLALAACGGSGNSPKKAKIGVGLYSDAGPAPDSTKAYLASLAEKLNVEFVYTTLTQTDEAANIAKVQELIAANCDGIIITMDMGMEAILKECQEAGVYCAGYLCDFDTSYNTNYDNVFKNPYFLGTVADGGCGNELKRGYDFWDSLMEYNEAHPDDPVTHVSFTTFPAWAFPYQQEYVKQFIEKCDEYNKTAATPIVYDPFDESTDVLMFSPVDSTYFSKHADIDAVMCICAGEFVYGTMVSAGVDKTVKLFAAGYTEGDNANFGSRGNGTYQLELVCAPESITYPLVLLLNKINGVEFKDMPAEAERRSCTSFIINSDADMELFEKSIYLTNDPANALLTPDDVYNLTAFGNENATYAGLVEILNHMNIEDLAK